MRSPMRAAVAIRVCGEGTPADWATSIGAAAASFVGPCIATRMEPFLPLEIAVVHGFDSRSVLYVAGERDCRLPVDRADIGASHGRDEIGNVARQQIRCLGIFQTLQPR